MKRHVYIADVPEEARGFCAAAQQQAKHNSKHRKCLPVRGKELGRECQETYLRIHPDGALTVRYRGLLQRRAVVDT